MSETSPESLNPPKPSPENGVRADGSIAGDPSPEAAPTEGIRLHPDDLAALQESPELRPYVAERMKAWVTFAERALLFAVLFVVIMSLCFVIFREIFTPVLMIESFEVPESFAKEHGLTGRAVAQMLRGEMTRIRTQASTLLKDQKDHQIVGTWESLTPDISVPGTGLTLDSVLRYLRLNEMRISGALLIEDNRSGPRSLRLHVHVTGRPDMLSNPFAPAELKAMVEAAAVYVFRNTHDYIYASYLIKTDEDLAEAELRGIFEESYVGDRNYALYGLGYLYQKRGRPEKAIEMFQRAIALDPESALPHNGLGNVYRKRNLPDEAIASYQRAIALDSKFADPHNNLGNLYWKRNRLKEAIASYQRAIALDPKFALPHNGLGNVYRKRNLPDEAIASYQRAIALAPKFALPHSNLGNLYWNLNRLKEAEGAYERAEELKPSGG